jgi:hypothetical protein
VANSLNDVLKGHYIEKKRAERAGSVRTWTPPLRTYKCTIKDAVSEVMDKAARITSANFTLLFSARQLYYQVRPLIQKYTSEELNYTYFTPPLLTDYQDIHGALPGLIYEPRGHFIEPHRNIEIPLGTVDVEKYTLPDWEYDKILYIEKEGFRPILNAVKLGQRYDMALMTAKGFASRAAKALLANAQGKDITILVAHDCDISGYEIARSLEKATRTTPGMHIEVIDLGLTVAEAVSMQLQSEDITIKKRPDKLLERLSSEEKQFLFHTNSNYYGHRCYYGKRVELNAMTTDQLISWLETKFKALGLQSKVLPPWDVVNTELKDAVDSNLNDKVEGLLIVAIEKWLGANITDIREKVKENIGLPETEGNYNELKQYLADCPPQYWRDWVSTKASKLLRGHLKDDNDLVCDIVSWLKEWSGNNTQEDSVPDIDLSALEKALSRKRRSTN